LYIKSIVISLHCKQKQNDMKDLIRIRVWLRDFQGNTSRTEVRYVETLEEAETLGWKYELA